MIVFVSLADLLVRGILIPFIFLFDSGMMLSQIKGFKEDWDAGFQFEDFEE